MSGPSLEPWMWRCPACDGEIAWSQDEDRGWRAAAKRPARNVDGRIQLARQLVHDACATPEHMAAVDWSNADDVGEGVRRDVPVEEARK